MVILGDNSLDPGDQVVHTTTTYTIDSIIGSGSWYLRWEDGGTSGGGTITGTFYLGTDGNVYFFGGSIYVPPGATVTDSYVVSAPSYFACFAKGTKISTQNGNIPVEEINVGDLVKTLDHGFQPVRWIGGRAVAANGSMAPVKIKQGTLQTTRDLFVSQQHRLLISDWRALYFFGEEEVLVAADYLVNDLTIQRVYGGFVTYFHILFDRHEIIFAEGIPTESFFPGEETLNQLDKDTRNEIIEIFPELEGPCVREHRTAKTCIKRIEATILRDQRV